MPWLAWPWARLIVGWSWAGVAIDCAYHELGWLWAELFLGCAGHGLAMAGLDMGWACHALDCK
jgi:hypothetical protein